MRADFYSIKHSHLTWVCLLLVCVAILTNGCAEMNSLTSPIHRQPVTISPLTNSLSKNYQPIQVFIQGPLPGKPVCETVWNSGSGPYIDLVESKQIGWNQEPNEWVGVASWDSILYVPFGRIFEGVFESGLTNAFPNADISIDCLTSAGGLKSASEVRHLVKITVKEFSVSEKPVQHINMQATVDCAIFDLSNTNVPVFVYQAHAEMLKQPVGYIHWTASPILEKMSEISNDLAAALSEDILKQMLKNVGQ